MRIKETIERECCEPKDLNSCGSSYGLENWKLKKCSYCNQFWMYKRELGDMDYSFHRVSEESLNATKRF